MSEQDAGYEYKVTGLISVRDAAKLCGKNPETIRRWIWSGKVNAQKLGNQLFVKREELVGVCRETAVVEYRPEAKPEFLGLRKQRMQRTERSAGDMATGFEGDRVMLTADIWNEDHAGTGKILDADALIRKLRDERERGAGTSMKVTSESDVDKVMDFLMRSRAFRDKLRKRTGGVDTAELVRESREERDY